MLLVNKATQPDNTVYFIAAVLNGILIKNGGLDYAQLYKLALNRMNKSKIEMSTYTLALDFLFLLDKINIDKDGKIYVYKKDTTNSRKRSNN